MSACSYNPHCSENYRYRQHLIYIANVVLREDRGYGMVSRIEAVSTSPGHHIGPQSMNSRDPTTVKLSSGFKTTYPNP